MFFAKKIDSASSAKKYHALHDKFLSLAHTSLNEKPFKLCWAEPESSIKFRFAYIEPHATYTEMLENIDNFINELKIERIRNQLLPSEKEKMIEALIIPLYELKKSIYSNILDYTHKCVTHLQESTHSFKYKKNISRKYLKVEKECILQIKDCEESIHGYKKVSCYLPCIIL